jgi:ferredoxin-thioredoxin reductase catalytic subunit
MKDKQTFNHNPNQSSVDWVIGEIMKHQMTFYGTSSIPLRIIEQGKAMHKDEITRAWQKGDGVNDKVADKMSLEYYKETFNL